MGVEGTRFLEGHLVITPLGFVPIRLASSCASLFGFSPSPSVTVTHLLFSSQPIGFRFCRGTGHAPDIFHTHLRSVRPPFLPPFFFPMGIRTFLYPAPSLPCAVLYWYNEPAFLSSIPPPLQPHSSDTPLISSSYGIRTPFLDLRPPSVRTRGSSGSPVPFPFLTQFIRILSMLLPADAQRPPSGGVTDPIVPPLLVSYFQFPRPTVISALCRPPSSADILISCSYYRHLAARVHLPALPSKLNDVSEAPTCFHVHGCVWVALYSSFCRIDMTKLNQRLLLFGDKIVCVHG